VPGQGAGGLKTDHFEAVGTEDAEGGINSGKPFNGAECRIFAVPKRNRKFNFIIPVNLLNLNME